MTKGRGVPSQERSRGCSITLHYIVALVVSLWSGRSERAHAESDRAEIEINRVSL